MSRLIDADKLIEEINNIHGDILRTRLVDVIEKLVDDGSCKSVMGWMPADKPPKPEEYVLLSFENFSVPMVGMYRDDGNGGAYCIGDDEESCISQHMLFVNAWMPLPDPYNPERSKT